MIPTNAQLADMIEELKMRIQKLEDKKKKPAKGESDGAKVFEIYRSFYVKRYGVEPVRNAMVNRNCSDLVNRLGLEAALKVVEFYMRSNAQNFVRNYHPLKDCLFHCEMLHTASLKSKIVTQDEARTIEKTAGSVQNSLSYLQKKHGGVK